VASALLLEQVLILLPGQSVEFVAIGPYSEAENNQKIEAIAILDHQTIAVY